MPKRVVSGIVTSDKMSKTRRVEINRLVKHPKYKKYIRRRTVCYAHDEGNESGTGDRVEIIESAPLSKLKRWRLVRVLEKSTEVDVAALRAAPRASAGWAKGCRRGCQSVMRSHSRRHADARRLIAGHHHGARWQR